MKADFRRRLIDGELLVGTIVTLSAPEVTEAFVDAGYNYLFIDTEHGPMDIQAAQHLLQVAAECPCIVRIPDNNEVWIKKTLDIGACGLVVPQVNDADVARQVIQYAKYPPQGTRSVGLARAQGYGLDFQAYVERANEEVAVIVQAEHIQAVENMASILEVEGVDAIFVGPYDLSASMGRIGQVDHPEVQGAIDEVQRCCQSAGKTLGIFGATPEAVEPYVEKGYRLITVSIDTMTIARAARESVARIRSFSNSGVL